MKNYGVERKRRAIALRRKGLSIGYIEKKLGINRSTLSGWFKNVELTAKQKKALYDRWKGGLVKARVKAVRWHNAQKEKRLEMAKLESDKVISSIDFNNQNLVELGLAMLYMGEGIKSNDDTGIGNSDPVIVKAFVEIMDRIYKVDRSKMRCSLYLRHDQDEKRVIGFWSTYLSLPMSCFKYVHRDKRTIGSRTYPDYKGVCAVACGNVAIKRKLLNISRQFCEKIISRA